MQVSISGGRQFEAGDVVFGRAVFDGKRQPRRKGIVLGPWTEGDTMRVVIWWYRLGAASGDTSSLMWNDELSPAGDIWDFSARLARELARDGWGYSRAEWVVDMLSRHSARMCSLGASFPVND